jgi:dienelactone hydrolase
MTLWDYYCALGRRMAEGSLGDVKTAAQWRAQREERRRCFFRSMGLDALPERAGLRTMETGKVKAAGCSATLLAYEILPGCWTTAALWLPDPLPPERLPGVVYACGHGLIGTYHYQAHPAMWARRGYACMIFNTLEQDDSPGDHHGTFYGKRMDWISMGYTAAGGELWNSIRATDVLAAQPMVDAGRIGATGISGGGAHCFYLAVADERIRAVAPACGVASLSHTFEHRHLLNHCDCMYPLNVHQADMSDFAALIAPRPILFCFARHDILFSPAERRGLVDRTRRLYALAGRREDCRLFEYDGPHSYQPDCVAAINDWFDRHVSGRAHPKGTTGKSERTEAELSVFDGDAPRPNRVNVLPELLCPPPSVRLPDGAKDWPAKRRAALARLREEVTDGLDRLGETLTVKPLGRWLSGTTRLLKYRAEIGGMEVWIELIVPKEAGRNAVIALAGPGETGVDVLGRVAGNAGPNVAIAVIEPRGSGFTSSGPQAEVSLLRAGALTGVTPAMLLLQDLRKGHAFLKALPELKGRRLFLYGRADAAAACLYQAALDETVAGAVLDALPASHREGAIIPRILRVCDLEQAAGLAAPRPVGLLDLRGARRLWAQRAYERVGAREKFVVERASLARLFEKVFA